MKLNFITNRSHCLTFSHPVACGDGTRDQLAAYPSPLTMPLSSYFTRNTPDLPITVHDSDFVFISNNHNLTSTISTTGE